jgi:hypothetical protein
MKIRLDYVTNSSSSGFIVSLLKNEVEDFQEYMSKLNNHPDAGNEGVRIYLLSETVDELKEYVNKGPLDWAQKPTGPRFNRMTEEHYNLCKEIIEEGGIAVECWIDYNVCEKFDNDYGNKIVDCFD